MAKIIKLKTAQGTLVEQLEEILQQAKEGKIKSFLLAAEAADDVEGPRILTAWGNADLGTRQVLVSHLQLDINAGLIRDIVGQLLE